MTKFINYLLGEEMEKTRGEQKNRKTDLTEKTEKN
jgi:hypothetical protein